MADPDDIEDSLQSVLGSMRIEGIEVSDEIVAKMRGIMRGELDVDKEVALLVKKHSKLGLDPDDSDSTQSYYVMAQSNPYYTKGTDGKDVLINKLGITTAKELEVAEYEITAEKLADLKARKEVGKFDYQHLKLSLIHI